MSLPGSEKHSNRKNCMKESSKLREGWKVETHGVGSENGMVEKLGKKA